MPEIVEMKSGYLPCLIGIGEVLRNLIQSDIPDFFMERASIFHQNPVHITRDNRILFSRIVMMPEG